MYRVAFAIDDSGDRHQLATALQQCAIAGSRIVAAFADAATVEVFLDVIRVAVPREIAEQLAQHLGVHEYEVARVDALTIRAGRSDSMFQGAHHRPAVITQARVHDDDRTISVQVRHRPHERVETIDVDETDDSVTIAVFVGAPDDDAGDHFVSLAVAFTWIETVVDGEVGARAIVRHDPEHGFALARTAGTRPGGDDFARAEPEVDLSAEAARVDTQALSAEEVLARLEGLVARVRGVSLTRTN